MILLRVLEKVPKTDPPTQGGVGGVGGGPLSNKLRVYILMGGVKPARGGPIVPHM